jgi:RHS repeat-associated protein
LQTASFNGHTVTHIYDPTSELRQVQTFHNGTSNLLTVNQRLDNLNRVKSRESLITGGDSRHYSYLYNSLNQRTRATVFDSSYWDYSYDALGQVDSAIRKDASDIVIPGYSYGYTFDDIGNRTQTSTNGRTGSYTPNILNQYNNRAVPRALDILGIVNSAAAVTVNSNAASRLGENFYHELDLSAGGNGAQQTNISVTATLPDGGDGNTPRVADAVENQFLKATPETFTHDADGNLTQDGQWIYTWDANNRLITMETQSVAYTAGAPRQKLEFAYDSQGRRFSKKVYDWDLSSFILTSEILYLYDGWNLIAELNAATSILITSYFWGADLSGTFQGAGGVGGLLALTDSFNSTTYPAYDGNGNIMGYYSSDTGTTLADFEYGPFGEKIRENLYGSSPGQAFVFTWSTKYEDMETGLLYYGYRYYNAETGRWLNRDPIEEQGGLNLYGMVGNDGLNYFDYLGLESRNTGCGRIFEQIQLTLNLMGRWIDRSEDPEFTKQAVIELASYINSGYRATNRLVATTDLLDEGVKSLVRGLSTREVRELLLPIIGKEGVYDLRKGVRQLNSRYGRFLDKIKPISKNLKPIAFLVDAGSVVGAFAKGDRNAQIRTTAGLSGGILSTLPRFAAKVSRLGGPTIGIATFAGGIIIDRQENATNQAIDKLEQSSLNLRNSQMKILLEKATDKLTRLSESYENCCQKGN